MRPVKLFISYASQDAQSKERLLLHFAEMQKHGLLLPWHDRLIPAGGYWETEIFSQMKQADAALLLVSKAFLESDFIQNKEIPALRERHLQGALKILPLILEPCDYAGHDLIYPLQLLTNDRTPLSEYRPPTVAYTHVANCLKEIVAPLHLTLNPDEAPAPMPAPSALPPLTLEALLESLPNTNPRLFGREREITLLDQLRQTKGVLVWVAGGGTGKSALVRHWLVNTTWPAGTRFLGHSFYSQGTKDQSTTSATFLRAALLQLGCTDIPLDNYQQGQLLAKLARSQPTVLVLDGVEPLQHAPDGHSKLGGVFKDQGLHGLLKELVREPGAALCLVSSRVHLADTGLRVQPGRFIRQHDLDQLSPDAAVALLAYRGVHGRTTDMQTAARHYHHHALALVLAGEYLHTFAQGRVEKALEIPLLTDTTDAGRHAKSVMQAYDLALQNAGEELDREMVRLLGLFDRPAEPAALVALKQAEPLPGLTEIFRQASTEQVAESLARLRQWGLLNPGDAALDAHPLVREWFGERQRREHPDAFRQAHAVLFEHYQQVPEKEQPDTLEELEPLYRAVRHGCLAGEYQEACDKVFWGRILRGGQRYSQRNLGAWASDLSALAGFFPDGFDLLPATGSTEVVRIWLVAEAAYLLMSLGRLTEAVGPRRVSMQMIEKMENWSNAAVSAQNLTDLLVPLGRLAEADDAAGQGLGFAAKIADKEPNLFLRMACHAHQGRVAHFLGRMDDAARAFKQAEGLQLERQPDKPQLYSLPGTHYALFLLERDGILTEAVLERGRYIEDQNKIYPQENAFGKLVTGLAWESLGQAVEAAYHLQAAVADMRRAGKNDWLPWLLLSHAAVLQRMGEPAQAMIPLNEAREIAQRGEMRLYLAECSLLEGEIALDQGRRQDAVLSHREAQTLIQEMGYQRRQGELLLLEARLKQSSALREQAFQQFRNLGQLGLLALHQNRKFP